MAPKKTDQAATHPFGWVELGTACAESDCEQNRHIGPLKNQHGYCQTHYTTRWANNTCMAPGCAAKARDVGAYGVYCDEHFQVLVEAGFCAVVGCPERAVEGVLINGYPVCSQHTGKNVVFPMQKWQPREKRDREGKGNDNDGQRASHTASPARSAPISEDEWKQLHAMDAASLSVMLAKGGRENWMARSEVQKRVNDLLLTQALAEPGLRAKFDELFPPAATAEQSQPPVRVDTKVGRKPTTPTKTDATAEPATTK